jgi:hypothetical protein
MRADEEPGLGAVCDVNCRWEFGGPVGTLAMMLGFPCLMCESSSLCLCSTYSRSLLPLMFDVSSGMTRS